MYIGTYTRRASYFGYHAKVEEVPYSDYIKERALAEYVESYYASISHPWRWGVFLKKMEDNLESGWLTQLTASWKRDLLGTGLDECWVSIFVRAERKNRERTLSKQIEPLRIRNCAAIY